VKGSFPGGDDDNGIFENDNNGIFENDELPSLYLMPNWVIYFGQTLLNGTFSKKL